MKKILIPTDFSDNAWNAIVFALEFFKQEKCIFHFLHTYSPAFYRVDYMMGGPAYSAIPDVGIDISLAGLEKTLSNVKEKYKNPKHQYMTHSAFNILTDEMKDVTERENIDLVVMGTKGATGAKEIFLGTNTVFAIRKIKVPILVVPENFGFKKIEKILFPVDFKTQYKQDELKTLLDMAKAHSALITVLHVIGEASLTENQKSNKLFLDTCLEGTSNTYVEIRHKHLHDAVLDYIDKNNFDLLAMMNRDHSFLERVLVRQNIDRIGYHITVPFLVMRDTSK